MISTKHFRMELKIFQCYRFPCQSISNIVFIFTECVFDDDCKDGFECYALESSVLEITDGDDIVKKLNISGSECLMSWDQAITNFDLVAFNEFLEKNYAKIEEIFNKIHYPMTVGSPGPRVGELSNFLNSKALMS